MGYKMGMPSMKLNNAGVKSKSCGSFKSVSEEALEERDGHDPDIDRERSQQNIYTGFQSAAELMAYSQEHVDQLRDARGRKLRADAVVMCATVLKPPAAYMETLPREEQIRLLDVAEGVLAKIIGQENIKATGTHFDELGTHRHVFWEPMTEDGRLCAKEMHNLQFFSKINREIPAALREAGFEIDDCEMYDAAKEEYEKEKSKAGRSSFQFKADAEKAKTALEEEISDLKITRDFAKQKTEEAVWQRRTADKELENVLSAVTARRDTIEELDEEVAVREDMIAKYEEKIGTLMDEEVDLIERVETKRQDARNASQEAQKAQEAEKAVKDRVNALEAKEKALTASVDGLQAKKQTLVNEVAIWDAALKEKEAKGRVQLGDAMDRRIADTREIAELKKRVTALENAVKLRDQFIQSIPGLWQRLQVWLAEQIQKRAKSRSQPEQGR